MQFGEAREFTERISCAISPAMRETIERIVAQHESSISAVMRALIAAGLEAYECEKEGG